MNNLGNRTEDSTIDFKWSSNNGSGASVTRTSDGTISVYKGNNTTQSTAGVTDTEDFDSLTGIHHCRIDTSADAFYVVGEDYQVVLSAATIDGQTVNAVLANFTIEKGFNEVDVVLWRGSAPNTLTSGRVEALVGAYASGQAPLQPTVSGRTLDVSAGGEAGIDWANIGSPTTAVNLSGTTVKTATDVETDTQDIQSRLPAALVGGRMDANVGALSGDATAADNAEAFFDGTGYAGTNNVIPTVTTTTNLTTNNDKTGYRLSATGVDDIHDEVIEGTTTFRESTRLANAANGAKTDGAATTTFHTRDLADTKNRVTATVDADGNRTDVTRDLT